MPKIENNTDIRIAEFIIPATMSKSELAGILGVSRAYVSMLTNGQRKPSKIVLQKLSAVLPKQGVVGSNPITRSS